MLRGQDLPVGSKPGWELPQEGSNNDEHSELKSVAASLVVVNSLKKSRATWLSSVFPKFSSKARGGKPSVEASPPAHILKPLGKCDLEIGPHVFPGTAMYEAQYLRSALAATKSSYPATSYSPVGTWPAAVVQYGSTAYTPYGQYALPSPATSAPVTAAPSPLNPHAPQRASTPLVSSFAIDTPITPSLVSQVNTAAATNPILANLLQLAASGHASPEQLKTLGLLVTSLNNMSALNASTSSNNTSSSPLIPSAQPLASVIPSPGPSTAAPPNYRYQPYGYSTAQPLPSPAPQQPVRESDIILEFREKPFDRWIIPRGPAVLERKPTSGPLTEILLSTVVPFPKVDFTNDGTDSSSQNAKDEPATDIPPEVITFRLKKVHQMTWDGLTRWAGDAEKVTASRKTLASIKAPERVYLQHQVPSGDLLTQLQADAAPPYAMKPLKPSHGYKPRAKRQSTRRKDQAEQDKIAPKRRKPAQSKPTIPSKPIACVSCGQTDVPLMIGGRFCRTCVDQGRHQMMVATAAGSVSMTRTDPQHLAVVPNTIPSTLPSERPATIHAHSPLATSTPVLLVPGDAQSQPSVQ